MSATARYHVRALDRSLTILRVLNQHNGLAAAELSRLVALPRPTVLRLLNTLSDAGYVARSKSDSLYRATLRLRELSCGYKEETWLQHVARPFLAELEEEVVWPLAVIRLRDQSLIVEALTDRGSQMVLRRDSPGIEVPLLTSSSGYLYMALLPEAEGSALLDHAIASGGQLLRQLPMTQGDVKAQHVAARNLGYSALHLPSHSALAVPVWVEGALFCALSMRMYGAADARQAMVATYLTALQKGADELGRRIGEMTAVATTPANSYR